MIQSLISRKSGTPGDPFPDNAPSASTMHHADVRDERLLYRVTQALSQHALQLVGVVVTADGGCVRLTGQVRSYYLKQLAQERTLAAADVAVLENNLTVQPTHA